MSLYNFGVQLADFIWLSLSSYMPQLGLYHQKGDILPTIYLTWRRKWQPTPVCLPGKSHGQRSLAGYSPWGCKESGMTKQLSLTILLNLCLISQLV